MVKQTYRDLCNTEPSIPIFSRDWWLDAVCGTDGWKVVLVGNNRHDIAASLPFYMVKKWGVTFLGMPDLTQTLGPWIASTDAKYAEKLSREKKLMTGLLKQLPSHDIFTQRFHHSITNWLPFYWRGFSQTTRYTYVIPELSNLDGIWAAFRSNIRREIRKAQKSLRIRDDVNLETFYRLNAMSFERQGTQPPYTFDLVQRIDKAAGMRDAKRIFFAQDKQGRNHAAIYIIWDQNSSYYLMGGADPELRTSGATSLLLWEAIRFSSSVSAQFDFEGSMIEPLERYFRAFGARQTPYFKITRMSPRYKLFSFFIKLIKKSMLHDKQTR
jgi:hypothetical protein